MVKQSSTSINMVKTRFAPSPTGFLHVGSARTALFNYLFAKKNKGSFVLRIEDTDKERSKPQFEKDITDGLKWLGIDWDGELYRQSERKDIYKKYLEKLIKENKAYYCFCPEEELEAKRQYQISTGLAPHYNGKCAKLSERQVKENLEKGQKYVIRIKSHDKKIKFHDLIRGEIEFDANLIGDFPIAKTTDNPLYNFAVVIDDYEMKISHIIRGEEHLSNTPRQILIQEALGLSQPKYAHIPLILSSDRSKLSKREGAVSLDEYRQEGYLPEAIVNFLVFLGWNPGGEREIFSLPALINEFSIEKVNKSGAIFNIKKLDHLNGFYIRQKSLDKLTELCIPYLVEKDLIVPIWGQKELIVGIVKSPTEITGYQTTKTKENISFEALKKIVSIYQERLKKLSEISELTDFFFVDKISYSPDLLKWKNMANEDINNAIDKLIEILSNINERDWNAKKLEEILILEAEKMASAKRGDRGMLLWPLRVALTGKQASAGPFEIMEIFGKEKSLKRLNYAKSLIK